MSTKENYRCSIVLAPSEDLDGAMCETSESVADRICALFGFMPWAVSVLEGDLDSAEIAGTRYFVHTSVRFTANGIGWSTDFTELVRDTAIDER